MNGGKKMKIPIIESLDIIDNYNIEEDLSIMMEVFNLSREQLFLEAGIDNITTKENLDKLYNYCYQHNLYLNEIKWQEYKELFNNSTKVVLCHGSRSGIKGNIRVDVSGESNDFGNGFYLGETIRQAGMFVSEDPDSLIYIILFNPKGLKYIRFKVDTNWMLAVAYYRNTLKGYANHPKVQKIINRIEKADYVIAPIADNRMFELIDAFVLGELTDKQTLYALSATHLGMQYVLKTPKTVDHLQILNTCYLCPIERSAYNQLNDVESNTSLNKALIAKYKYKNSGLYIDQLLKSNLV